MSAAWYTEMLKLRRSRLWWITLIAMTIGVGAAAMFMFILLRPEQARDFGLLGAKHSWPCPSKPGARGLGCWPRSLRSAAS